MRLHIGKKIIGMSAEELDKLYLNEGSEAVLYRLGDTVLKFYKENPLVDRLSKEDIEYFKTIKCKRFVLPDDSIVDDGDNLVGYSSGYLEEEPFRKIFQMNGSTIRDEILLLLDDVRLLSKHGIEIDDLHLSNLLVSDNKIYFVDPGGFHRTDEDFDSLYKINKYRFEKFIVDDLFGSTLAKKNRKKLEMAFSRSSDLCTFLEEKPVNIF